MTDQELRRLSRSELLEMLVEQMKENEELKIKLKRAQMKLRNRQIAIDEAGSIAEAALKLNEVFEAADKAAKEYLDNVRRLAEEGSDKE
ncbi:MAG: DNA repair protein [Lachnospiraceae bacterium]|nr:DNA repair protein [Lachnospiraceae bacterium]